MRKCCRGESGLEFALYERCTLLQRLQLCRAEARGVDAGEQVARGQVLKGEGGCCLLPMPLLELLKHLLLLLQLLLKLLHLQLQR